MKFLENTPLERIDYFLNHLNLGECTIKGSLEAYSCKSCLWQLVLDVIFLFQILDYLGKSDSPSPDDYLLRRSRCAMKAHQFFSVETWETFRQIFNNHMAGASKEWMEENDGTSLLESIYKALDEVINLSECEIYSYNPDSDSDPLLEEGAIWSFSFFFYNRKLKRVVSFCFCSISNLMGVGYLSNEEDGEIFDDMDM
ncbi:Repressor of RNA polymerase III transcription MAF1 homolog [Linum perenne]